MSQYRYSNIDFVESDISAFALDNLRAIKWLFIYSVRRVNQSWYFLLFRGGAVESIATIVYENPIPPRHMINGFPRNLRVPFSARCHRGNRRVSLANTLMFMKKEGLRGTKETAGYCDACRSDRYLPFVALNGEFRRAPRLTIARFIYWSFYRRVFRPAG